MFTGIGDGDCDEGIDGIDGIVLGFGFDYYV